MSIITSHQLPMLNESNKGILNECILVKGIKRTNFKTTKFDIRKHNNNDSNNNSENRSKSGIEIIS